MTARYDAQQEDSIAAAVVEGRPPACPVCEVPMDRRRIEPRDDVSYVRHRLLLSCPVCSRRHVVDLREDHR